MNIPKIFFVFGLLCAGCAVGPDYRQPPDARLPDEWRLAESRAVDAGQLASWWQSFNDPLLNELIRTAFEENLDIQSALARVEQARAMLAYTAGETMPTLEPAARYSRNRGSQRTAMPFFGEYSQYSVGFDSIWEIDLFGRIRRSVQAARADWQAAQADAAAVQVAISAEIGRVYAEYRTLQQRRRFAQTNAELQQRMLDLTRQRLSAQLAPALDEAQARLILTNTQAEIPLLDAALIAASERLSVLTRIPAGVLRDKLNDDVSFPELPAIAAGVPADLLRRRPDIRRAERVLAAETERIGAIEALRYPMLSLSGYLNSDAAHWSDLGRWDSRAFSVGPGVRWRLFDGNRITNYRNAQQARVRQAAADYELTVINAASEVETLLARLTQQMRRTEWLAESVAAAQEAMQLVETLYRSGLTDFQNVLESQRSLTVQQDRLAESRGLQLQYAIALYKALGGGWQPEQVFPENSASASSQNISVDSLEKEDKR